MQSFNVTCALSSHVLIRNVTSVGCFTVLVCSSCSWHWQSVKTSASWWGYACTFVWDEK